MIGLKISNSLTSFNTTPVEWVKRNSVILDTSGKVVFSQEGVEVPDFWSQTATDILASKYFRKAGINFENDGEYSLKQVIDRIVTTIGKEGFDKGYFDSIEDKDNFEKELSFILIHQYGAFNSPVLFNCGLYHKYGIVGKGENYHWDNNLGVVPTINTYEHSQCSACFIQSVEDDLLSIYDLVKTEVKLFKYGSGTGTNFSPLRSKYEKLSGGGYSSGLMSFLAVFDRAAGATKSGGVTRRAAKMVCLNIDHPEIEDFITWKSNEEKKVRILIDAGYSSNIDGEAYQTVSGQNSNNSIRVTDMFMMSDFHNLNMVTTGEIYKTVQSKDLWNKICESAWECGDPGLQFDTTVNVWNTCAISGKINASNPCAEFLFLDNSACNLATLNLVKFLDKGEFNLALYQHVIRLFIIAQDILVDLSSYPTAEIAKNSHNFRPLGLGFSNLGSLLMLQGMAYGSENACAFTSGLTSLMTGYAYLTSIEIAQIKGSFKEYDKNKQSMNGVINHHFQCLKTDIIVTNLTDSIKDILDESFSIWKTIIEFINSSDGFRNAQVTLLPPAGTISFLMDCDTTGIEPEYSLVKEKKLVGGGSIKIYNKSLPISLKNLGYDSDTINRIIDGISLTGNIDTKFIKTEHVKIFACSSTDYNYITADEHLNMMACIQPFISGGISKTVNLPNSASISDVQYVYKKAWNLGLKSIIVYRDRCKSVQPLTKISDKDKDKDKTLERIRLPKKRLGFTQEAIVGGTKIFVRTGEYSDKTLGEIFIDIHKEGAAFRSIMNCFAIAVSLGLQYGVPLETFVEQFTFTRFEPQGIVEGHSSIKFSTSLIDFVFRLLGVEYLNRKDLVHKVVTLVEKTVDNDAPMCNTCGNLTVRSGTCYICVNCGTSMGCS